MFKRLLAVDKKRARKIKKLISNAKNNTERKRIQILVQYL
jgi:ribosomal protein L22